MWGKVEKPSSSISAVAFSQHQRHVYGCLDFWCAVLCLVVFCIYTVYIYTRWYISFSLLKCIKFWCISHLSHKQSQSFYCRCSLHCRYDAQVRAISRYVIYRNVIHRYVIHRYVIYRYVIYISNLKIDIGAFLNDKSGLHKWLSTLSNNRTELLPIGSVVHMRGAKGLTGNCCSHDKWQGTYQISQQIPILWCSSGSKFNKVVPWARAC